MKSMTKIIFYSIFIMHSTSAIAHMGNCDQSGDDCSPRHKFHHNDEISPANERKYKIKSESNGTILGANYLEDLEIVPAIYSIKIASIPSYSSSYQTADTPTRNTSDQTYVHIGIIPTRSDNDYDLVVASSTRNSYSSSSYVSPTYTITPASSNYSYPSYTPSNYGYPSYAPSNYAYPSYAPSNYTYPSYAPSNYNHRAYEQKCNCNHYKNKSKF